MKKHKIEPVVVSTIDSTWKTICPNSNGNHFIMISSISNYWGCAYCDKKGNFEDFKNWIREIQRKKFNEYVKDLNTNKEPSLEQKKWWLKRY